MDCIQNCPRRLALLVLLSVLGCAIMACSPESSQPESDEFTADELYLIEAYVDVRLARSHYPHQPAVAESLFTDLATRVDTTRIAHTISTLNLDPDRWAAVYAEIERRMREIAQSKSLERSRGGTGAPAQVE